MYPTNHKTVIVLDHTPYFGISSGTEIEFPGVTGMGPISKSLWTCSLEPAIEYCRLVWDLFPQEKLVRLIVSDTSAHSINSWSQTQQRMSHIINGIAAIGTPPSQDTLDHSVLHGLQAAIAALSQRTDQQNKAIRNIQEGEKISNRCRAICITSVKDNDGLNWLEDVFLRALNEQNEAIHIFDGLLMVDHLHLVILNVFPSSIKSAVNDHPPKVLSPNLITEVHSMEASHIPNRLYGLFLDHYGLASTTITNVIMKQTKFDVEFFHSPDAHKQISTNNYLNLSALRTVKDDMKYHTMMLKSRQIKGEIGALLDNSFEVHRAAPLNSRATFLFTKTLLKGTSYSLEVPTKVGGTFTSHILTARGGDIFIHSRCFTRSLVDELSLSTNSPVEKIGDYRIKDFSSFIRRNTLYPINQSPGEVSSPLTKMKMRLNCQTRDWPITKSSSLLFNLRNYLEPLLSLIKNEALNDEELFQCNTVIYNLNACELKMKPLPLLYDSLLTKGRRLEEQYQAVWDELKALVKDNLHSEKHRIVYRCLLNCHRNNLGSGCQAEKFKLCKALEKLDSLDPDWNASLTKSISYPPTLPSPLASTAGPISLYDIINSQQLAKQVEGRGISQLKSHLYASNSSDKETPSGGDK